MKLSLFQAFTGIILIIALTLVACTPAAQKIEVPPTSVPPTAEPTNEPTPSASPTPEKPAGLVASLDDVQSATIQIEGQGTFLDPEFGLVVNGAGRGSGFIIDSSGIAVTNNHVVTGAALLKVWVGGNKEKSYNARVLGVSECSDLAVIKIEGENFPYLDWHEGAPKVGLEVYAAGFPLGDPEYTLTKGIVSKANADGRTNWTSVDNVLEHDARINPGNSGGPLVDQAGKIVGINYANNASNQYFAITRTEADKVLGELQKGNDVNSIGVNGQVVVSEDRTLSGIWVSSVKSGSPADKSGVKAGDIIVQMEGLVLGTDGTMADYCQILRSHKASDTLSLTVLRWQTKEILEGQLNGRELAVTATYGDGQASSDSQSGGDDGTSLITDDSNVVSMVVPNGWEYDGSAWESTWTIGNVDYPFTAQTLTASPSVSDYNSGWNMPGIFIATSADWGSLGGYANLLEGVRPFYNDCRSNGTRKYNDGTFEGLMQLYAKCGPNKTDALVLAARPVVNSSAYLVLIEIKYATEDELNALDAILGTANINP